jgi:hypothetical protein
VPVLALRFGETVSVELDPAVTGFGLKLPLVFAGNPLTLRLIELDPPTAEVAIVYFPLDPRLTVNDDGDAASVKSGAGADTTTVSVVEWFSAPLAPLTVIG